MWATGRGTSISNMRMDDLGDAQGRGPQVTAMSAGEETPQSQSAGGQESRMWLWDQGACARGRSRNWPGLLEVGCPLERHFLCGPHPFAPGQETAG